MSRPEAILADIRSGLRDFDMAQRHGVTRRRISQIRRKAGLPPNKKPRKPRPEPIQPHWTAAEVDYLVAHAGKPDREVATAIGRTPDAVRAMRRRLIAEGRIAPGRVLFAAWELALLTDTQRTDAEVARQTGRTVPVIAHARRLRGIVGPRSSGALHGHGRRRRSRSLSRTPIIRHSRWRRTRPRRRWRSSGPS